MVGKVVVGSRVLVQFGRKKFYTALVIALHNEAPTAYQTKDILELMDAYPIVLNSQLALWRWIAEYYLCAVGDVYKAALPAGLKVESETIVMSNPDFEELDTDRLSEKEREVLSLVRSKDRVKISELNNALGHNAEHQVQRLLDREALFVSEKIVDNYRAKSETFVTLSSKVGDDDTLHRFFDEVKRSQKQEQLLMQYIHLSGWMQQRGCGITEVSKKTLLQKSGISANILSAMVKKGIFELYKKEINRFASTTKEVISPAELTLVQRVALEQIHQSFREKNITLLRGVTSSGKTEIYIHLIKDVLSQGAQALYLVPEIALTTQLTHRLQKVFGEKVLIYHSKFSDNERVDIYKRLLNSPESCVVIGVRSSVFLPFRALRLIIVDEEHETSFKQQDPAPRYNARSVAIMLAHFSGAKTLLGSGTPAIESYYNATTGKYGLVELLERHQAIQMPKVEIVNISECRKDKQIRGIFSFPLLKACRESLANHKQVILFQNRRGYAPMVTCKQCAWVPKCDNCDVSLTYHKYTHSLTCHYCGHTLTLPSLCPACRQPTLSIVGYGTERIEDDIEQIFEGVAISRMDLDTTRNKNSYDKIIDEFSQGKTNMLIGTQMVSKGLDFDNVNVVGVLNADTMINFPDFRATERAFNMLEQVSGRAGRKDAQGRVIIQTNNPAHPIFDYIVKHDFLRYYQHELKERKQYFYPPFTRIIEVHIKHKDDESVEQFSRVYASMLREVFAKRVLGPQKPFVSRIQQWHLRTITLKVENEANMSKVKAILRHIYEQLLDLQPKAKSCVFYYDVDPL